MVLAASLLVSALAGGVLSAPSALSVRQNTTAPAASAGFQQHCAELATALKIPSAKIQSTEYVAAGTTLRFPNAVASCGRASQAVSANVCRVVLDVPTSNRSGYHMEAWLPENWTGRFLSTGNGGLGGCIQFEDIDYATSLGFAAVGTNNGHDGQSGETFLNNPEVIADFAFRALHGGVVVGKQITQTFYDRPHTKSYYLGCSTGGRQGFKSAQAFPDDFDGIVAGAPAFAFNNLTSWSCHFLPIVGAPGSETFVPTNLWSTIHDDIMKQCDTIDGVADNVIEDPNLCNYNPDGLICGAGANTTNCLTATQAKTVRAIYEPLLDDEGSLVYPRLQPGEELRESQSNYFSGAEFGAADWFKFAIYNDSNFNTANLVSADYIKSSQLNLFNIETFDGNLAPFQSRGSKILHYHGLIDGTISSENSQRYYEHVSKTMGLAPAALDDFYRYFRISGMAHCGGGNGAAAIGNQARNTASLDPKENVLMAMVDWVEKGVAPETITGTAFVNENPAAGVAYKRAHCKWPARTIYSGSGDPNLASSWGCGA